MEIKTNGKRNIILPDTSNKKKIVLKDINGEIVSYIKTGKNSGRITGIIPDVVFAELEDVPLRPVNSSALNIAKTLDLTDEVNLILEKQNAIRQAFGAVLDFKAEIEDRFLKNKEQTDIALSELAEVARNTGIINDERYEEIKDIDSAQNIDIEKIYSICRELSSKASLIEIDINNITNVLNAHEHEKQTKESLGLGKVDNTSDIDKPVSKAVQEALDEKVNKEELTEFAEYIERLKKRQGEIEDGIQSLGGICANPIPIGGKVGDVLMKRSDLDGDFWWAKPELPENATEEKAGIAKIATQEDASAGTDDTKIMTPLKVATVLSKESTKLKAQIDANADAILKTRNDLQAEIDENTGYITELQADTTTLRSDLDGLGDQVSGIEEKIPDTATSSNQLADKNFVNSSIATETATFKGTFNTLEELEAVSADNNDYGFVISKDTAGNTIYNRYKYNGSEWVFEYALNNSSFTASQWASINSGATQTNISQITTNKNDIVDLQNNKQDVISDLDTIRSGSGKGATAVQPSDLSTVATSGSYNDLSNKPTLGTMAYESASDYTKTSGLATVATSGDYDDLLDKPTIPSKTSDLNNDSGFITSSALSGYATENWVGQQGYITGITSSMVTTALGFTPYNSSNPNGYQENVIESIKVNGSALTPTNKAVDITVPSAVTESTVSGWGFTKNTGTVTSVNNISPIGGNVSIDLSVYQTTANLVTSVSSSSTDTQYPSAKCLYDLVGDVETLINAL